MASLRSKALFLVLLLVFSSGLTVVSAFSVGTGRSFSTSSSSPTTTTTASAPIPTNSSQLVDESPSAPFDDLDPAVGFFVTDGYFANVFQGMVTYNGTDYEHVVPALASTWAVSPNFENYTFTVRLNTHFSNNDPINAYTAWFSLVRENYLNAPTAAGYANYFDLLYSGGTPYSSSCTQTLTGPCATNPDAHGNVWPWGLKAALISVGVANNENSLVHALNNMLSHFSPANTTQQAVMSYPHQALVVTGASTFTVNLIQPYPKFLLDIANPWGSVVDPTWVDNPANCGGVQNNTVCAIFDTKGGPGSGPYMYGAVGPGNSELILKANPNYWATGVSGLAAFLQPPHIKTIIIKFASTTAVSDFDTNAAQIVAPPTDQWDQLYSGYAYKQQFTFGQLIHNSGYPLCDLAYGLNTQRNPTNSTLLREGIVHAINYSSIEQQLYTFNGTAYGELFLPPVPPGWGPLDNPSNIPLYSYNINLAAHYVNLAGIQGHFFTVMNNGTVLGDPSGKLLPPIGLYYTVPITQELKTTFELMNDGLQQVGITVAPQGLTSSIYGQDTSQPSTTPNTATVGWCADWPDPIFQQFYEMATEAAHEANWVNNATLNALLTKIPFETSPAQQLTDTKTAYNIFTQLSTIIQMPLQAGVLFEQPDLQNVVYSSFQFGILYNMITYQPTKIATVTVGTNPYQLVYDPSNNDIYVANRGSNTVSVISGVANTVVATVSVGTNPYFLVCDPSNNDIYVGNYASATVSVINGATNKVIATVSVGANPNGLVYDPSNNDIYVANHGSNTVSVISGTTNKVIATISVGGGPALPAYDPSNNDVYVTNQVSATVSVISGATNKVVTTLTVGTNPYSLAYDPSNNDIYATNFGSNTVSVISGTTNKVIATVSVGAKPGFPTYDLSNQDIYVANFGSNTVSVMSGSTNKVIATVSVGINPYDIVYDPSNNDIYVTNQGSNTVSVISGATNTVVATVSVGNAPLFLAYDSANHNVYATNLNSGSVSVISSS